MFVYAGGDNISKIMLYYNNLIKNIYKITFDSYKIIQAIMIYSSYKILINT